MSLNYTRDQLMFINTRSKPTRQLRKSIFSSHVWNSSRYRTRHTHGQLGCSIDLRLVRPPTHDSYSELSVASSESNLVTGDGGGVESRGVGCGAMVGRVSPRVGYSTHLRSSARGGHVSSHEPMLCIGLLNAQSTGNKHTAILNTIYEKKIQICLLTKTWHQSS